MNNYIIIKPQNKGSFTERLGELYINVGDYLESENIHGRNIEYCKIFLSDIHNQHEEFVNSLLFKELLSRANFTIIEQPPLDGSKISLLIKTNSKKPKYIFQSIRLNEDEAKKKSTYEQTVLLFKKYIESIKGKDIDMPTNLIRTWIYVANIDKDYAKVVEARNDIFRENGLTADTHFIASTGIGGECETNNANVAIDFLTYPDIKENDKKYLEALEHLNPTKEYGVAFERGTRLTTNNSQIYFISGTASIDKKGDILYKGDVKRQTARLFENIGALLADGNATMNDIKYFIIYLRDISDYNTVEKLTSALFPKIPHIIVKAKVCRPGWLIETECIAQKVQY